MGICNEELPSIKPQGPFITWFTWSREILDLVYLNYHKAYDQIWQGGDVLWEASTHKVTQPFEYKITGRNVINLKHSTSTITMPMTMKSGSMVIYNEELPSTLWSRGLVILIFSYLICRFRTQTAKVSPTSCYPCLSSITLDSCLDSSYLLFQDFRIEDQDGEFTFFKR